MKIVFFGSGDFAVPVLDSLVSGRYEIVCVVTQPDRKAGRHLKPASTAVKLYCLESNLLVFQPENLSKQEVYSYLKKFNADLFIVVSYGKIIPKRIIDIPKIFSLNVHASLLPKYRGAAPINWAIINGEEKTGVSIIKMNEFMDRGQIILQKSLPVSDTDDAQSLTNSLARLGVDAIIKTVNLIKDKEYILTEQDEKNASYAPKLTKQDGLIDWNKDRKDIFNQIRGLFPWPGTYTYFGGKMLKIFKADYLAADDYKVSSLTKPGQILNISPEAIFVSCGKGTLVVKEVQIESGKKMSAYNFAIGHKIKKGDLLG